MQNLMFSIVKMRKIAYLFRRLIYISPTVGQVMTSWPDLEPMPNSLVNYGVTDNGIAIIELASNSAGAPLEGDEVDLTPTLMK